MVQSYITKIKPSYPLHKYLLIYWYVISHIKNNQWKKQEELISKIFNWKTSKNLHVWVDINYKALSKSPNATKEIDTYKNIFQEVESDW